VPQLSRLKAHERKRNFGVYRRSIRVGTVAALDEALAEMHEQVWDDEQGMVRLYGLHLVRETALGAFLDLENARVARAERALREVLRHQYPLTSDARWAGTFKTHTAQSDAGTRDSDGRVRDREWRDYDPNWRQFLGVVLWITQRLHGHVLPDDLNEAMLRAANDAACSERPGRIDERYSNIALMHVWLQDACGIESGGLATAVAAQIREDGDIAEYNSPTYDAISLLAACLLANYSNGPALHDLGNLVRDRVGRRLTTVWHGALGVQAGPYSRAYGFDPRQYVSLVSVMMTALGVPAAGPTRLDVNTTHVHDLYFLPLFRRLCGGLRDYFTPLNPGALRRYEQRFGDTVSTSVVESDRVTGWEHGRRSRFALDQYAPFAMYSRDGFIGVRTRPDTDWVDVLEIAPRVYELRCARRTSPDVTHDVAALTIVASRAPVTHENEMLFGDITLQFPGITVEVRLPR
jgi:hypothetical protein